MNSVRTALLAAAAVFAMGTSAIAENWDGFYIGKLGFYNMVHLPDIEESGPGCEEEYEVFCALWPDPMEEVGVAKVVGFNVRQDDVVYGIDAMFGIMTLNDLDALIDVICELDGCPIDEGVFLYKLAAQAMGRIGWVVNDNMMVYGAAGLGMASLRCAGCDGGPPGDWEPYAAVAAGIEVAATQHLLWRTHVQYSVGIGSEIDPEDRITSLMVATGGVWQFD